MARTACARALLLIVCGLLALAPPAPAQPGDAGAKVQEYRRLLQQAKAQGLDTREAEALDQRSRAAAGAGRHDEAARYLDEAIAKLRALVKNAPGPTPAAKGARAPVLVIPFTHHYAGPGGYYAPAAEVRQMATFFHQQQIPGTLFFDGILVERLLQEDPSLLPQINAWNLPLGYHGEETHGPYPVASDLCAEVYPLREAQGYSGRWSLTTGVDWLTGVKLVEQRYTHAIPYRLDDRRMLQRQRETASDLTRVGGLKLVQQTFGRDVSMMTSHALESAPEGYAFRRLSRFGFDQPAVPIALHALKIFGIPQLAERAMSIAGADASVFWIMGRIMCKGDDTGEAPARLRPLREHLGSLDRRQPRVLVMGFSRLDPADAAQTVGYLNREFFAQNPGSGWASGETLANSFEPEKGAQPTRAQLLELAGALSAAWQQRPPDVVTAGGLTWSLCDLYEAYARALAAYGQTNTLPEQVTLAALYGPIAESGRAALRETVELSLADLVAAAGQVARGALAGSDDRFVPATTTVGGRTLNAAELLAAWAAAYQRLSRGESGGVRVPPAGLFPPYADVLDAIFRPRAVQPVCYTKGQLWTVKPVRAKGQAAAAAAAVPVDQPAGDGAFDLVFAANLSGSGRCYREDPNGADLYRARFDPTGGASGLQRLTRRAGEAEWFPAMSPDGRYVAYNHDAGAGPRALHEVRALDTVTGRDVALVANARFPSFSADGQWLTCSTRTGPSTRIVVMPFRPATDGAPAVGAARVVADERHGAERVEDPAFFPDGRRLVFHRKPDRETPAGLAVIGIDGAGFTPITPANGSGHAAVGPDGHSVVATTSGRGGVIQISEIDGRWREPVPLALPSSTAAFTPFEPRFGGVEQVRHTYLEWVARDWLLVTSHGSDARGRFSFARLYLAHCPAGGPPRLVDLSSALEQAAGRRGADFCTGAGRLLTRR